MVRSTMGVLDYGSTGTMIVQVLWSTGTIMVVLALWQYWYYGRTGTMEFWYYNNSTGTVRGS